MECLGCKMNQLTPYYGEDVVSGPVFQSTYEPITLMEHRKKIFEPIEMNAGVIFWHQGDLNDKTGIRQGEITLHFTAVLRAFS